VDEKPNDLISESVVKLIFNQIKESSEAETKAISTLIIAVTTLLNSIGSFPSDVFDLVDNNKEAIRENKGLLDNLRRDFSDLSKEFSGLTEDCEVARRFYMSKKDTTDKIFETNIEAFTKKLDIIIELLDKINTRYWKFLVVATIAAASSGVILVILQFIILSKETVIP